MDEKIRTHDFVSDIFLVYSEYHLYSAFLDSNEAQRYATYLRKAGHEVTVTIVDLIKEK